ncbi:MAG: hypothetical protein IJY65_05500 [Clostridia bacterium]|nr:hypothetical protein [Clostridia bacterium]
MKDKLNSILSRDYRHYICIGITLLFLGLGFLFPNALPRVGEAFRDLGTSLVYYFYGLFADNPDACPIAPTVIQLQVWKWGESPWEPLRLFPWSWEEFKVLWQQYWTLWATGENVQNYIWSMSDILEVTSKVLILVLPLALPLWLKAKKYTEEQEEDDEGAEVKTSKKKQKPVEDSKYLKRFKRLLFITVYPVVRWCKSFVEFIRENKMYYQTWLFLWLLYFNVISVGVAFIAFYLYFVVSFDFIGLYMQLVKLLSDLTPMIRFIPGIVWFVIGYFLLDYFCKEAGYSRLEHNERKNRGFLNERGVVTVIYGNMGTGKTRMLTSLALSAEKQLRDQALEILLETDMKFPNFPWVNLRSEVKHRMEEHTIVDIFSIRRWIRAWKDEYLYLEGNDLLRWYQRRARKGKLNRDITFGYDIEHYRTTYNDNLTITHIYDAIEDYAQAFFVYSIQTSLVFSNYAIRVDFDVTDNGHFPLYNDDFFRRNPKYQDMYSKYCHIIDFDMLRLGKRMLEDNPNKNALGFGVYVVSEIDKERKNELEIRKQASARKKSRAGELDEEECTQNNDLFNACLKMIRHATVIANRVFVKVLCDLQRPEDWGAGGREVGEVVFIEDKGEKAPVLPLFSPYWLISCMYVVHRLFFRFYLRYMGVRDDDTLLLYLFKNTTALYAQYIDRTEKLFGCQTFKLEVESGRMDGKSKQRKFYGMDKKDFSRRYSTDAMSSIFDLPNTVSIADFIEYSDIMATKAERDKQLSHFQRDIDRYVF